MSILCTVWVMHTLGGWSLIFHQCENGFIIEHVWVDFDSNNQFKYLSYWIWIDYNFVETAMRKPRTWISFVKFRRIIRSRRYILQIFIIPKMCHWQTQKFFSFHVGRIWLNALQWKRFTKSFFADKIINLIFEDDKERKKNYWKTFEKRFIFNVRTILNLKLISKMKWNLHRRCT